MNEGFHDLWPDSLLVEDVMTPLAILRFQAARLEQRTKGKLKAEIHNLSSGKGGNRYSFRLIAPLLENYTCELFSMWIPSQRVYPAEVYWDGATGVTGPFDDTPVDGANSQAEFEQILSRIFQSSTATAIVQSLIAMSNEKNAIPTTVETSA